MTPLEKPVRRVTRGALDGSYGADRGRKLVAALDVGDVIALRPMGTRRTVTLSIFDAYRYAIACRANKFNRLVREYRKGMSLRQARAKARKELGI
jgi:hypothetical protein